MRLRSGGILVLGVLLAACGGGGGDDEPAPTPVASATVSPEATATPSTSPTPSVTASPFPEVLLAAGRRFAANGSSDAFVLRNDGAAWVAAVFEAPSGTLLNGIVFSSPDVAWAFGFLGDQQTPVLWRSSDTGRTWTDVTQSLPTDAHGIADLAFADAETGFMVTRPIVAGANAAFVTHDGGASWSEVALAQAALSGAYSIGTRGPTADLVRYDSDGLSVVRLDDPTVPPTRLAPAGGSRILGANAVATLDSRGWIALSAMSFGGPSRAAILTSAAPGAPWAAADVDQQGFGELYAIDVRDARNAVAGGRGRTPTTSGLVPLILVLDPDADVWRIASVTGVPTDASVVDVLSARDAIGWAIVDQLEPGGGAAFLRSDDGGRSWRHEVTSFENGVQLDDLARNTTVR